MKEVRGISSLALSDVDSIENFSGLMEVKEIKVTNLLNLSDISALKRLESIEITNCPLVKDLHLLKRLQKLVIFNCPQINDVSLLGKVRHLKLLSCANITDVSCLSYVYDLVIQNCDNIMNVSRLTNNSYLSLINNRAPPDLRSFRQIKSLEMNFDGMNANVKPLLRCYYLTLIDANFITNLYLLKNLRILALEYCNLESLTLPMSHQIRRITLSFCDHLEDISFVNTIPIVIIKSCKKITSLNGLHNDEITSITIDACDNITDFSPLCHFLNVKLISCWGFCDGHDVMNVQHLTLSNCPNIKDVSMLRNVMILDLWYCYNIRNIQDLTYNYKITAIKHYKITDFDVLKSFYHYEDIDEFRIFLLK